MSAVPHRQPKIAAASVETFSREVTSQPEGQCQIEWTTPDGLGMQCEVFRWQRIDGFSPGDIIDITTQGRGQRTLSIPVQSTKQRVEITLNPEDMVVVKVGEDGWEYGAVIRGARPIFEP